MSNPPTLPDFDTFGEFLRHLRRRARMTQRELGLAVGYSEGQINRFEHDLRLPDLVTVKGQFVEALALQHEPALAQRLIALATQARSEASDARHEQATARTRTNLPAQLTSFIGREQEIKQIRQLLNESRLVTLIGAGGVGKTRLAQEVATKLVSAFGDGVWYVELAALSEPALVPQTVVAMLKLIVQMERAPLDALADYFEAKQALLILDNCEHLIAACAGLAMHLLQRCPKLRILATSRETLRIPGESVYRVPSLTTPPVAYEATDLNVYESVRLFIERARVAQPAFELTPDNSADLAQICRRLDGIPLAIELVAARIKALTAEQIGARLGDRFSLLTTGIRTALPRHQTLRAAIDWSYELLTSAECALLRRLSVFAGGWTLEAAEAVCAGGEVEQMQVLDLLTHLADKSLLILLSHEGVTRFGMLDTIREYALEKLLMSSEADQWRRRHAEYYLVLAKHFPSDPYEPVETEVIARVSVELENLRFAIVWSLSMKDHSEIGYRLIPALTTAEYHQGNSETLRWLGETLLQQGDTEHTSTRAYAIYSTAETLALQPDFARAQALWEESLKLYRELGDTTQGAFNLIRLAWVSRERGNGAIARILLEESLEKYRSINDAEGMCWALLTLSEVAVMQEDPAWAVAVLEQVDLLNRNLKSQYDAIRLGWYFNHLGHVAQLQGDYEHAKALHGESLIPFGRVSHLSGLAWANHGFGETALSQGDSLIAKWYLGESLKLFRRQSDKSGIAWILVGFAGAAALDEAPNQGALLWGAGEGLRERIGSRIAPASRKNREQTLVKLRKQLRESEFERLTADGRKMMLEQAVEEALQV